MRFDDSHHNWFCDQRLSTINLCQCHKFWQSQKSYNFIYFIYFIYYLQLKHNLKWDIDYYCDLVPFQRKTRIQSCPLLPNHILLLNRFFLKHFWHNKNCNRVVSVHVSFVYCHCMLIMQFNIHPHLCISCNLQFKKAHQHTICSYHSGHDIQRLSKCKSYCVRCENLSLMQKYTEIVLCIWALRMTWHVSW